MDMEQNSPFIPFIKGNIYAENFYWAFCSWTGIVFNQTCGKKLLVWKACKLLGSSSLLLEVIDLPNTIPLFVLQSNHWTLRTFCVFDRFLFSSLIQFIIGLWSKDIVHLGKKNFFVKKICWTWVLFTLQEHQKFRTNAEISVISDSMLVYRKMLT